MPHVIYRFLRWCPGVLGLLLRQKLYPYLLGQCGRGVLIGRFVDMINPRGIALADNVILNDGSRLDAGACGDGEAGITLGKRVFVGAYTILTAGPGRIAIGEGSNIGSRCLISAGADVLLADHVLLAGYCSIGNLPATAVSHQSRQQNPPGPATGAPTAIGRGCWLGLRSQVAAGAKIGEGTIVGAHAFVDGVLPDYAIAVGRPAGIMRLRP